MPAEFVRARPGDIEVLLGLMPEYYAYDHLSFDPPAARAALGRILSDEALGCVWLIQRDAAPVGYMVLTFGFSLEFHGRDAFVDELYLREAHRGEGIGRTALRVAEAACAERGIHALHLEVERGNTNAQAVYRKAGFVDHDRYLLTRWIAPEE